MQLSPNFFNLILKSTLSVVNVNSVQSEFVAFKLALVVALQQ